MKFWKKYIAFTLAIFILLGNISVFAESSNNIENVNNVKSNEIIEEVNNEELKNSEEDIQLKDEMTEDDVNFDLDEENEKSKDTNKAEENIETDEENIDEKVEETEENPIEIEELQMMEMSSRTTSEGFDVDEKGVVLVNEKNNAKALMSNPYYKDYFDDSIFGIAGNFFLTGFTSVNILGHTHGNVLTRELINNTNFGSGFPKEISYIQDKISGENKDFVKKNDAILVLGEKFNIKPDANMWNINGSKINSPQNDGSNRVWKDDTEKFIDLDELQEEMLRLSKKLSRLESTDGLIFVTDQEKINDIGMNGVNKAIVIPETSEDFYIYNTDIETLGRVKIGVSKFTNQEQTFIFNIDAKGNKDIQLPSIVYSYNGNISKNEETSSPSPGNVIVNVYDSTRANGIFDGKITTGTENNIFLLSPKADVKISEQFNGLIIAENIENSGTEIHRDKPIIPEEPPTPDEPEELIDIPVEKTWKVKDEETIKDKVVEVKLLENGVFNGKILKLTKENNWKDEFKNLPTKDSNGKDITYDIEEISIPGFDKGKGGNQEQGFMLINSERPVNPPEEYKINIPVEKTWKVKDEETIKDKVVEVKLLENGAFNGKILKLTKENNWKDEFKNLPTKDSNGKDITYDIEEISIPGFDKGKGGNQEQGFMLINSERPVNPPEPIKPKTEVSVEKIWKDEDGNTINADNINKTITIRLFADGEEIDKIELNSKDGWSHVFKNLPKEDKNGNKIKYTIKEDKVSGYDSEIKENGTKFNVINKEKPTTPPDPIKPKTEVSVEKIWKDEDGNTINADNINKTITIRLFADGEEIDKIELNSKDGWSHVFKNLPKEDKNGNKIKYTIKEDKVSGYDSEIIHESGKLDFTVINKKDPTEPKIPNEPEEPTLPNEPRDPIESNEPQKSSEPLKPITKTKSTRSPQTYRGGIALVVTELVAGVGAFVFIRKRIKSIEK